MALGVYEDVVRFQVPVNIGYFVDTLHRQHQFCYVEPSMGLGEDILLHQESHQVPPLQILHHQVEVAGVLEGVVQLDHPLVLTLDQDVPLCPDVVGLLLTQHLLLLHFLDGHHLATGVVDAQSHLPEGPPPDDLQGGEVTGLYFLPLLPLQLGLLLVDGLLYALLSVRSELLGHHFLDEGIPVAGRFRLL